MTWQNRTAEQRQQKLDEMTVNRDFWRDLALSCFPESSLEQRKELLQEIEEVYGLECRWGACTRNAHNVRYSPPYGWLPVCQFHTATFDPKKRRPPKAGYHDDPRNPSSCEAWREHQNEMGRSNTTRCPCEEK